MNRDEQKQFVESLTESVAQSVIKEINEGNIPSNWDGIELRWLLAEHFERNTLNKRERQARYREYENAVIVNNL